MAPLRNGRATHGQDGLLVPPVSERSDLKPAVPELDDKKAEVVEDKVAPTQAADLATTLEADGSEPPVGYETKGCLWINNPTTHLDVDDADVYTHILYFLYPHSVLCSISTFRVPWGSVRPIIPFEHTPSVLIHDLLSCGFLFYNTKNTSPLL